jgi:nucleoside-diphosphate-sugar epimerase
VNISIWGEGPFRKAVIDALNTAGHSLILAEEAERNVEALVLFPSDDPETATRGIYERLCNAANAGVKRIVLVSTLAFFNRIPQNWRLTISWRPRPGTDLSELCPWLSELSVREITRVSGLQTHCLRLGENVSELEVATAIIEALIRPRHTERCQDWTIEHLGDIAGRPSVDPRPWQEVFAPTDPIPSRPLRRVVIFGAGGPLGAVLTQELAPHYQLRITDARAMDEIIRENRPQKLGAPLPVMPEQFAASPYGNHESRCVDVRDEAQVFAACASMDAIINCTVVRQDPLDAFRVNTLGAYHMARAAVEHRIRRLVQTGPELISLLGANDYSWDYDIACDPPPRPGCHLYGHSKYLGQEILRVFAHAHDLEIPNLLFSKFGNPEIGSGFYPMMVSWRDAARALRAALEVPTLPSPYEEFHVTASLPHGRFRNDKLQQVLGWEAKDGLERFWQNEGDNR